MAKFAVGQRVRITDGNPQGEFDVKGVRNEDGDDAGVSIALLMHGIEPQPVYDGVVNGEDVTVPEYALEAVGERA